MKYSAGMVSRPFWYVEEKKTAKYLLEGLDKNTIKNLVITENIYQAPTEYRAIQIFNTVYKRLTSLDESLLFNIVNSDVATSKIIALFSIMKTDELFFEFMYEVFREKLILGDYMLRDRDVNVFFSNKKTQSDIITKWTDYTIEKLKRCYTRVLYEAGLIVNNSRDRKIVPVNLDYKICQHMQNDMSVYLNAVIGGN